MLLRLSDRLRIFGIGLTLLLAQRLAFLSYHQKQFEELSSEGLIRAFILGGVIDASTFAIILMLLLGLETIVLLSQFKHYAPKTLRTLIPLAGLVPFLANAIDLFFFQQFDSRLNSLALDYLDGLGPVAGTATQIFPLHLALAFFLLPTLVFGWGTRRIIPATQSLNQSVKLQKKITSRGLFFGASAPQRRTRSRQKAYMRTVFRVFSQGQHQISGP